MEDPLTLQITAAPVRGNPLLNDYLAGEPGAARFYAGNPRELAAWREKLAETARRFGRAERQRAAGALRPTSPAAAERLRRFVDEGGAMVTTGQQAGLFTGPLYTVNKILNAIRLAEALEEALGIVVLPVFWVASEDHDFAEAAQVHAVDAAGALRRFALPPTAEVPLPMSEMRLGEAVDAVREDFIATLGGGADAGWAELLRQAYRPAESVAGAFSATIERLFAGFDLLLTDAADPALKRASAPLLLEAARAAGEHERLLSQRSEAIRAAGYTPQVALVEGASTLFWHGPRGRERLDREGRRLVARASERSFHADELARLLEDDPRALSPNVLLRPVVESAVFPTLAYVAGPAEAAYFAQIGPLFEHFGIRMPLVFPRFGATLEPAEAIASRARLGLDDASLARPGHELWDQVARAAMPRELWEGLSRVRQGLVDGFAGVMDQAAAIDPNLEPSLGTSRNRALLEVARAERSAVRHFKQRHPELRAELDLVRNHLRPLGVPQERVLGVFQYLARDPGLLRRLAEAMPVSLGAEPAPRAGTPSALAG